MSLLPAGTIITNAHAADGLPARIQQGSCDALSGVAFRLTGVGADITPEGTPVPPPETFGSSDAFPLAVSETMLVTRLSQLTEEAHAIVVYESDEAMDRVIACGNVGGILKAQMAGMIMPGDELLVWLAAATESGSAGIATLRSVEGGNVAVTIVLSDRLLASSPEQADDQVTTAKATPAGA